MSSKLFFGFSISTAAQIYAIEMIEKAKNLAPQAEWIGADKLHVTLLFVGECPTSEMPAHEWERGVQSAGECLLRAPSFRCTISHPALFSSPTLYLRVEGTEPLLSARERLVRDISGGNRIARGAWTPHLTLAKGGPRADLVAAHEFLSPASIHRDVSFNVVGVSLYKTISGEPYQELQRYWLGPELAQQAAAF